MMLFAFIKKFRYSKLIGYLEVKGLCKDVTIFVLLYGIPMPQYLTQ